jgi:hypothetical protein
MLAIKSFWELNNYISYFLGAILAREWRKFYELYNLYMRPCIVRMIKSRRMK